jgi:hypothetical protein
MYGICGGGYFVCQASHLERVSYEEEDTCMAYAEEDTLRVKLLT